MTLLFDMANLSMVGHCKIIDPDTLEVLVDRKNAINFEAMSYAIVLSLAGRTNGPVEQMVFGNGASAISATGVITYQPPNVTGLNATLYNQTYQKFVNDTNPLDTDPSDNFLTVNHTSGTTFADLVVTCLLDYNEPSGQQAFDTASVINDTYTFDEIGLSTWNPSIGSGSLLTHVIFNPVQKALNRRLQIIYSLRIAMA